MQPISRKEKQDEVLNDQILSKQNLILDLWEKEQELIKSVSDKGADLRVLENKSIALSKSLADKVKADQDHANVLTEKAQEKLEEAAIVLRDANEKICIANLAIEKAKQFAADTETTCNKKISDLEKRERAIVLREADTVRSVAAATRYERAKQDNEQSVILLEHAIERHTKVLEKLTIIKREIDIQSESNRVAKLQNQAERDAIYSLQKLYASNR